jgi:hypothetical protein
LSSLMRAWLQPSELSMLSIFLKLVGNSPAQSPPRTK